MSAGNFFQKVNQALCTGEWWASAWWRESHYCESYQLNQDEVEQAYRELEHVFDKDWFIGQVVSYPQVPLSHPVASLLLSEGSYPFGYLLGLGRDLYTARQANLLTDGLVGRLKQSQEYLGARFEIEFLAYLLTYSFSVEIHPHCAGSRRPDYRVSKGIEELFLELKRRMVEFPNDLAQEIMDFHTEEKLDSLDKVFTHPKILELNRSAQKREVERVFRLIKEKVKKQLPSEKPGLVIFEMILPLDLKLLCRNICRYGKTHPNFLGVLLVSHHFDQYGIGYSLEPIPNIHARCNMMEFSAVRTILESSHRVF